MSLPLCFEELKVGDVWRSRARTITETDVINFASLTGDFDRLHVDHEYARQSLFGQPIAHGLLGLSFVAGLSSTSPLVDTVAFISIDQWEFTKPIYFGDTVHVVTEVIDKQAKGRRRGAITWRRQLINQKGEQVQTGQFQTLVAKAKATAASTETASQNSQAA